MPTYQLNTGQDIIVDQDVAQKMQGRSWRMDHHGGVYPIYRDKETGRHRNLSLAALIFGAPAPKGFVYAHVADRLDFTRAGLRLTPRGKHSQGLTGRDDEQIRGLAIERGRERTGRKYTGVFPKGKSGERWFSAIRVSGKQKRLGSFATEEEAARLRRGLGGTWLLADQPS